MRSCCAIVSSKELVDLEDLEAEDIEHAYRGAALAADGRVDAPHEVVEEVRVDRLGIV